ncbi:MAG: helix-turn-helix transcriptional regulator [Solitalea sp.]
MKNTDNTIGKNIKALRQTKNWSQEQVATRLGITAPAFSKIECGFTDINYSRLKQIADLFGLSVVELITYHNQEEQKKYQSELQKLKEKLYESEGEIINLQKKIIVLLEEKQRLELERDKAQASL